MDKLGLQNQLEKLKQERQQALIHYGAIEGRIEILEKWVSDLVDGERQQEQQAVEALAQRNGHKEPATEQG